MVRPTSHRLGARCGALAGTLLLQAVLTTATATAVGAQTTGSCRSGEDRVCLTAAAGGKVERVALGTTVTLDLARPSMTFGAPRLSGSGLVSVARAVSTGGSVVARYRAVRVGRAAIESLARPRCVPGTVCPQFVLLWRTQISVVR